MNTYLCVYKGKRREVTALRTIDAQEAAAAHFKAKKTWQVDVYLMTKDGGKVTYATTQYPRNRVRT